MAAALESVAWVRIALPSVVAVFVTLVAASLGQIASTATRASAVLSLDQAQRVCAGGTARITLPDQSLLRPRSPGPIECRYRLSVADAARGSGLLIPDLAAHARIEINGHVVFDSFHDTSQPVPRSADRIVLIDVPDAIWSVGANLIDIRAAGPQRMSLSALYLGPLPEVRRLHRLRVFGVIVGPSLVAAVVGTVGMCMALLWARRRDPLYGYFGIGTLCWAVHTLWTVLPWSPLSGVHHTVWWTSLYSFFATMLVIFCVRFADWRSPRFERVLWTVALSAPVVLYAALSVDGLDLATDLWRLLLICLVGLGVFAVVRTSLKRPDMDKLLVVASGLASFAFGVRDWLTSESDGGNNPIYLVPYAGLVFVVFVVRMLIDRFAHAEEQLEVINAELEQRVASQNTELRDAMEKMRQARDAAEAADHAKTRFLAAASHDLRQPAHALALYMAALRSERLDPTQADLVQRMSGSLSALETMFNMLLDMSRIDAGALTPAAKTFAIEPMLRQLAEEFAPQAEAQGLRLALRLPSSTAAFAHSDPVLVERIVRNLLANAVKYTSRGGILVACRLRRACSPGNVHAHTSRHWRIEVWDTGVGIADHDKRRVFEEFFQVDNPDRDRAKGLGLGLSIVHRLVKLLGLNLLLYSRPGRGSCFALCLPQATVCAAVPAALPPAIATAAVAGMTVGMIEDDMEVRDAMRTLLQRWGCTVVEGADADELELHVNETDCLSLPDALLVDHRLRAGKTGPAEANVLFERWEARAPMLIVTGESDLEEIKAAGYACLAKPVSPALLRNWLASIRKPPADAECRAFSAHAPGDMP